MISIYDETMKFIAENKKEDMKCLNSIDLEVGNKYENIINYAKQYVFKVVDNRGKGGSLWVYHDKDDTIHALEFREMGMKYKAGRGWWIK